MNEERQHTLAGEVSLSGMGVHSAEEANVRIRPADPDTGIVFRRTDLEGAPEVPADLEHVVDTDLGTTLGGDGEEVRVLTVEHLMAALYSRGVTNAMVEVDGPELPIRDGSFRDYSEAIEGAGVVEQDADAAVLTLKEPVSLEVDGGASYVVAPGDDYRVSGTIDYPHDAIGRHYGSFEVTPEAFSREIAPARTFGFKSDAEALWERGLARASSLENSVILDDDGVMNDGLRFPDEFLRHKVGDIVGDLALLGSRIQAHVVANRPSHKGNVELGRALRDHVRKESRQAIVDVQRIMEYLPHRYPMLLVDRIVDFEEGKRIVGIKNVTINEPFFQGHYPGHPIMPGVLIIEAMAQVGGLLLMDVVENPEEKVVYFMSLDEVKWRRPVTPGDQLVFELEMLQFRRTVCKMKGTGFVEGNVVAEAELMARIMER